MNFERLFNNVLEEKRAKLKPMSGFDYYKSIRKATPKPGTSFKDKSKYSRKEKHKKDLHESASQENVYRQILDILSKKGLKAYEQTEILDIIQKAIQDAYREGYKAAESNPFK